MAGTTRSEEETRRVLKQALELTRALGEAIEAAGPEGVPSGHLYAMVSGLGMRLDTYRYLVEALKSAGKVCESGHALTWQGNASQTHPKESRA